MKLAFDLFVKFKYPIYACLVSRVALLVSVYLGLALVPLADGEGLWKTFEDNIFLDGFARWDSGWYFQIAEKGYSNIPNLQGQRDTAFFPAFPILLSLASSLGRRGMHVWGFVLNNALFCVGLCCLYDLTLNLVNRKCAKYAVCLAAFGPFSVFFSSIYTESLYFAATTASFCFAYRNSLIASMAAASLSAVTRVVGIIAVPFSLFAILSFRYSNSGSLSVRRWIAKNFWMIIGGALLGLSLFIVHLLYLKFRFGNFYQFALSQNAEGWSRESGFLNLLSAWRPLLSPERFLAGKFYVLGVANSALILLAIALVLYGFFRKLLPFSMLLWSLFAILISSSIWFSGGRFVASIFSVYILAGFLLRRVPLAFVVGGSAMLMSLFAFVFSHWYWLA